MTTERSSFPADREEALFRRFLRDPSAESPAFEDNVYARVADALRDFMGARATPLDVAVLLRHVLRRASVRDGVDYRLVVSNDLGLERGHWQRAGVTAIETKDGDTMLEADPWRPDWLGKAEIDTAAAAGTVAGARALYDNLPADPFFREATTYPYYRTAGQRAAVRAAVSMPDSATLIALLPTGSGKTEVATAVAHLAHRQATIIVVPTVSLAYDFERRFRELFLARNQRLNVEGLVFAWTGQTSPEQRDQFRTLLVSGQVPLLVTSPESLTGALLNSVRNAADAGRLRALVIDEAHLVTQWGHDFRPEFRHLASLRADLLRRCEQGGHPGFRTVLLSGTLGGAELDDLAQQFGQPGPLCVVAANALRPEPEYWVAEVVNEPERAERVLEAISRLPRPAILYVTRPEKAEWWLERLCTHGFGRVAIVTGNSAGSDRRDVLAGLRSGSDCNSRYDLVVATSAFGLGIDNDQIRTVVHACLPETLDRWYQEVGRSGRDGNASVALLLSAYEDDAEASGLGITMLRPETSFVRWTSLWQSRRSGSLESYVDLHHAPPGVAAGSYNRRWNAQLLRGLEELGRIRRRQLSLSEAAELALPLGSPEDPHEWQVVELAKLDLQSEGFFEDHWEQWRSALIDDSSRALAQMRAVLEPEAWVCNLLSGAYRPSAEFKASHPVASEGVELLPGCGRCPGCRAKGIVPKIYPPPRGTYTWTPDLSGGLALARLLAAAPTGDRVAILHSPEPALAAAALADAAVNAGVRLFAGVSPAKYPIDWWCTDSADVNPVDLPPLPTLVFPPVETPIDQAWLAPGLRPTTEDGTLAPLILLVKTGTPIGARRDPVERLRTLDVDVALRILASSAL